MTARPRAGALADVLPSVLSVLGVPGGPDPLRLAEALPGVRRIVVLLVDGLGYHLLPLAAPSAPTLAEVLAGRLGTLSELAAPFPSTTPASLTSLGTGVAPGAHGILGFTLRVPGTSRVLSHVQWTDDPDPATWQPVPTLFARAAEAGVPGCVVARPALAGTGLSNAAYRGARYVGAPDEALAGHILGALEHSRLVYGYYAPLDSAAHLHGVGSAQWHAAASEADLLLARLVDRLPPDTALLVTADHGALDVPEEHRLDMAEDPRLHAGVEVVAGEPRVRYLHTRAGAAPDVLAAWREVLGSAARVLSRDEAVAGGWFGPVAPAHLARIGDVVVACRDRYAVLNGDRETVGRLVGFHGSDTEVEVAVPLIVYKGH